MEHDIIDTIFIFLSNIHIDCKICDLQSNFICSGCFTVFYCSRLCQKKDWNINHKNQCKQLKRVQFNTVNEYIQKNRSIPNNNIIYKRIQKKLFISPCCESNEKSLNDQLVDHEDNVSDFYTLSKKPLYEINEMTKPKRFIKHFYLFKRRYINHSVLFYPNFFDDCFFY